MAILGIIGVLIIAFIILGLAGWGVQALVFAASFLGKGITGCIGCFLRFFWYILLAAVFFALLS